MITQEKIQEFEVFVIRNEYLEVRVIPALGAKIIGVKYLPTGREWMWRPPGEVKLFANKPGDLFGDGPKIGADEFVPTIEPCEWQGKVYPSCGEAWTAVWDVNIDELPRDILETYADLPISKLSMKRRIRLNKSALEFNYELINTGETGTDYLWACQALLAVQEQDRVLLPSESDLVTTELGIRSEWGRRGLSVHWPVPEEGTDFSRMRFNRGNAAIKLYTDELIIPVVAVKNDGTGEFFVCATDMNEINTFALWINKGGWDGYHHVGIAPSSGAPDSLAAAVEEWKRSSTLAPRENRRWTMRWHLGVDKEKDGDDFLEHFFY
ncbi:MAG: hypothetical protein SGI71_07980 [Verrucomicrobiota bacterium]|nr:hypothetical protein [Verrucomicrobiota bacterium]